MSRLAALIPVLSWVCLNAATGVLLTVTPRHRVYVLPAILVPATVSFKTIHHLSFLPGLPELWGSITLIGLIHFSSLLYIKKWTLRTAGHRTRKGSKATEPGILTPWLNRGFWTQMYKLATNPRFIKVHYKDIILFEQPQRTGGGGQCQVKSTAIHGKFSRTRILWLLLKIGMHLLFNDLATSGLFRDITIDDFAPAKAGLLRRLLRPGVYPSTHPVVSTRDIAIRLWFTTHTIWTPILVLDGIHTALAVLFIHVLRIDTPDEWPDLFGSPLQAFTLGRFWTVFWHRIHLSGYSDYAHLILPQALLRNPVTQRCVTVFSLFLISGLIHQLTSWQLNNHPGCADFADLQFFGANAAAVCVEAAALRGLASKSKGRRLSEDDGRRRGVRVERSRPQRPRLPWRVPLVRLVGYVWVLGFFVWVIPKVYYPRIYCMLDQ